MRNLKITFNVLFVFMSLFTVGACDYHPNPEMLKDKTPNKLTFDEKNDRPKMAPQVDNSKVKKNKNIHLIESRDSIDIIMGGGK